MGPVYQDEVRWYVAQLKPNGFARAEANLKKQGFETFMPLRRKTVRHARQMREVLRRFFQVIFLPASVRRAATGGKSIRHSALTGVDFEAGKARTRARRADGGD